MRLEPGPAQWSGERDAKGNSVVQHGEGLWLHRAREGDDVFVHISAVERAGMRGLKEGQKLQFDLDSTRGEQAVNIKPINF